MSGSTNGVLLERKGGGLVAHMGQVRISGSWEEDVRAFREEAAKAIAARDGRGI